MLVLLGEKELNCATVDHGLNTAYPTHTHLNMELIYVSSGMRPVCIEDKEYTLEAGSLAVIFPLTIHMFPDRFLPGDYYNISISPVRMENFRKILLSKAPVCPVLHKDEIPARIAQLVSLIISSGHGICKTELLDGLSVALTAEIIRSVPMQTVPAHDPDTATKLFFACAEHYTEFDFTMETLSEITGVSTRTISRFFSERLKVSFPRYLMMLRLQMAEKMLMNERKSVTETAFACGFGSIRSFNRCFTELYGDSPSRYRIGKLTASGGN